MRSKIHVLGIAATIFVLSVAYVSTSVQDYLPKYFNGALVDSSVIDQAGKVGIGISAPLSTLHVSTSSTSGIRGIVSDQYSNDASGAFVNLMKSRGTGSIVDGDILGSLASQAYDGQGYVNGARIRFLSNGTVGTGSVPTDILFTTGSNAGGTERARITSGGNVGIGTVLPLSTLHVVTSSTDAIRGITNHQNGSDANGPIMNLMKSRGTGTIVNGDSVGSLAAAAFDGQGYVSGARIRFLSNGTVGTGSVPTDILLATGTGNGGTERARITSGGNVGIGTATPSTKLHVIGDVTVTGNIAARYQDIAEWVLSADHVSPGTVMVLGDSGVDMVHQSKRAYDTGVVGVVSPQPGITLGEKAEGKILVAHSGRVRVKVDATYGAVQAGDLLVTSPTVGYAMRSTPLDIGGEPFHRPGTVVGKAIEALPAGKGEVLALLTLQ